MAPLTALIDVTTSGDNLIKLFYATGKAQLGLAIWSTAEEDDPNDAVKPPQDVADGQYIVNPSQMASVNFQGEELVFALTTDNPFRVTRLDAYNLAQVSPSYQTRLQIGMGNSTLAACASSEDAWVYYAVPAGTDTRSLVEFNIKTSSSNTLPFTTGLWIDSYAAAWYDTASKKRSLIYESSSLVDYCVDDATWGTPIAATGDVQRNTPLAVAFEAGKVYLYYCGRTVPGGIRRTIRTNNAWGWATDLDCPRIAQDSQLSVVRVNGVNHLLYAARDQEEEGDDYFVHFKDKID